MGLLHTSLITAAGGEASLRTRFGCLHEPMTLQEFSEKLKPSPKLDNMNAGDAGHQKCLKLHCMCNGNGGAGAG